MDDFQIRNSIDYIDSALVGVVNNMPTGNEHFGTLVLIQQELERVQNALYKRLD
jgi:hypothetical protein